MNEALRYVESRAKQVWDYAHSRNPLSRLWRFVFRTKPIQVVWIEQYEDDGDWDRPGCTGEVIRSWRYDADGLTPVDRIGEIDRHSHIASTTAIISFCVDNEVRRMKYAEWYGVLAGGGCTMKLEHGKGWIFEGSMWKSR